jgi:hypothetical protein
MAAAAIAVVFGIGYAGWSLVSEDEGGASEPQQPTLEEEEWAEAEPTPREPEPATDEETSSSSVENEEPAEDESGEEADEQPTEVAQQSDDGKSEGERQDEMDRPVDATRDELFPGQARNKQEREEYKPAVLEIVTNFEKAEVTVNGLPYPEYVSGDDEEDGMVLPAGGPYTVRVKYDGKEKVYTLSLDPYEVRVMMVELSGYEGGAPAKSGSPGPNRRDRGRSGPSKDNQQGNGRVTVYSKPKGTVQVDGSARDQKTPGTIEVEAGQHDIQVQFDDGSTSESKTVRVREGSRIKLFFRKRD